MPCRATLLLLLLLLSVGMQCSGSHKANLIHPAMAHGNGLIDYNSTSPDASDAFGRAVEVHQKAGDALLFVDCSLHGSAPRTTTVGCRRFVVYRYGPGLLPRYGYVPSPQLLRRLTPAQRAIIAPIAPLLPPGETQLINAENGAVSVGNGFGRAALPTLLLPTLEEFEAEEDTGGEGDGDGEARPKL